MINDFDPAGIAPRLLDWYDRHRRVLPWRAPPGAAADPYAVWLSEAMLQQTTVATVGPYYEKFLARWPTVGELAAASLDDVLVAWAGLGYYARARNLHRCARTVAARPGGRFPDSEAELVELPGIGPYTAAAIAAIAFDAPATVVDGNVERVVARLFALTTPLPAAKPEIRRLAATLTPMVRPGDFAQATMDLGATVCTPRRPVCLSCPLGNVCQARAAGVAESLPARSAKPAKPTRRGVAFWLEDGQGRVLVERRPEKGLLGGMTGFPGTEWREGPLPGAAEVTGCAPAGGVGWTALSGHVIHVFTHFALELTVWRGRIPTSRDIEGKQWVTPAQFAGLALPTVMKKVAKHARTGKGG